MSDAVTTPAAPVAAPVTQAPTNQTTTQAPIVDDAITPEEQAELDAAPKTPEPAKKFKLKIDGEEGEYTEEELKSYASLGKAARKRMQEAAEVTKQHTKLQEDINTLLTMLQQDPLRVLQDLGTDIDKLAADRLNKRIEEAAKSPEQKEREQLLKEKEELADKLKKAEDQRAKEEKEKMDATLASQITKDIEEALDGKILPKHPNFVRKVADIMTIAALVHGVKITAKEAAPIARKQILEEQRETASLLDDDALEEAITTERVASLRKRYLQKMKQVPPTPKDIKPTGAAEKTEKDKKKAPIKAKDFFKSLGSF